MLDPRIEIVRTEYGLRQDDFWKLPQGRDVWLVKHAALEVVAAKAGIQFDAPQILEADGANGVAAICVRGTYKDRSIWSIGEASPKNCKNAYPWAIAEKRAVDRVVLKLIGLHGLVYSEEESDDFKAQPAPAQEAPKPAKNTLSRDAYTMLETALRLATTKAECKAFVDTNKIAISKLPPDWQESLRAEYTRHFNSLPDGYEAKEAAE